MSRVHALRIKLFADGADLDGILKMYTNPLNIFQADEVGCHIITATNNILAKLTLVGKDLDDYSLETVEMFRRDALAAGYQITTAGWAGRAPAGPARS